MPPRVACEQALALANQCGDPDGTEERSDLAARMLEIGREAADADEAIRLANERYTELLPYAAFVRNGLLGMTGHHIGPAASGSMTACGLDGPARAREFPVFGAIYSLFPAVALISAGRRAEAAGLYRALGPVAEWQPISHAVTPVYALGIVVEAAMDAADESRGARRAARRLPRRPCRERGRRRGLRRAGRALSRHRGPAPGAAR
ncbi:MAG: hypothetical protein ACRDRX_23090 [Pseudonocardiaceae bacterium]